MGRREKETGGAGRRTLLLLVAGLMLLALGVRTLPQWSRVIEGGRAVVSDPDASYADDVEMDGARIAPVVTWGINPGQAIAVDENVPRLSELDPGERATAEQAFRYMDLKPGQAIQGTPIDVAFIGSCTNGRISDLREAARVAKGRRVAANVRALVVPGSEEVKRQAEAEGLHELFIAAGFQWRDAGCSMCLAMNDDRLAPQERCASTSNRNFEGRQGQGGRTHLVSPAMAAAVAIAGHFVDVRTLDV